jgi:hypothetical protein
MFVELQDDAGHVRAFRADTIDEVQPWSPDADHPNSHAVLLRGGYPVAYVRATVDQARAVLNGA